MVNQANIGIIGLGVMGHSLALNMERNGFVVAGYDVDPIRVRAFLDGDAAGKQIIGADSLENLAAMMERPRRILAMVPAGAPVDAVIAALRPVLQAGDILIDGGNSYYLDTERRSLELSADGFHFIGMGVSGGEEGALWGPSLMPGGPIDGYNALAPILRSIAAKAEDGEPCVAYMGPRGAGHYVKMVHNGIEYADMQLIAEAYDLLHRGVGLAPAEIGEIFAGWNEGELHSYLIEITADILCYMDEQTGKPMVEVILDDAQQKGTGKWTSQNALEIGAPTPTINAAVESRILSSLKAQRVKAAQLLHGPTPSYEGNRQKFIDAVRDALYVSKITSYAQGMGMLKIASLEYDYKLNLAAIARVWRAGCIIRARLLNDIADAYSRNADLVNLLLDENFRGEVERRQDSWRFVLQNAIGMGIPTLAMSASLAYFDAYRSPVLPANLTQAQRDYFGAHTYRRVDLDGAFHTQWTPKETT